MHEDHQSQPDTGNVSQTIRILEQCMNESASCAPDEPAECLQTVENEALEVAEEAGDPEFTESPPTAGLHRDDALTKIVGERMIRAREMNGLNQIVAAGMLGYKTSAPLSKIEAGNVPPPRWLIPRAAVVYGVSSDYLMGLSEYPEREPRTIEQIALFRGIRGVIERNARTIAEQAILSAAETAPLKLRLAELIEAAESVGGTLQKIRDSSNFDDEFKGGARLVNTVAALLEASDAAHRYLARRAMMDADAMRCTNPENSRLIEESPGVNYCN